MPRVIQASATKAISLPGHMKSKNLYEVLDISPTETAKDIKRAYRKLARKFHPDHAASPGKKNESTQMFLRIHNVYVTLSDPVTARNMIANFQLECGCPLHGLLGQVILQREGVYGYSHNRWRKGWRWEIEQCW